MSERYLPSIWRFVYTRVDGDPHLAEDIVSETMLALIRAVTDEATKIENPGGWLRSVANHKVQDHYRAVARVRHLIDEAKQNSDSNENQSAQDDPAKCQEQKEQRAKIRQIMDALSDQHRNILEWKYLDKLSVREIAERCKTTEKAVESILFRARRDFRERFQKTEFADDLPASRGATNKKNKNTNQGNQEDLAQDNLSQENSSRSDSKTIEAKKNTTTLETTEKAL